jgi:hypothetical protein
MAKNHGARQQKRVAKQKAKRSAKRSLLQRVTSKDPTVRLQQAEKWPVVKALGAAEIWDEGIGYLAIARQESAGRIVFALFLVDVYCLGVKNAFWHAGTPADFQEMVGKLEATQTLRPIAPACLAKIVKGAVAYAKSFGFAPHPDYRHAATLLEGIDPSTCPDQFTFGRDGKPFYMQGPNESPAQAEAISQRVKEAGGHYVVAVHGDDAEELLSVEDGYDQFDLDEDDSSDESF